MTISAILQPVRDFLGGPQDSSRSRGRGREQGRDGNGGEDSSFLRES